MYRVQGDKVMSDISVRDWCWEVRDWRSDANEEKRQGRYSFVTGELIPKSRQNQYYIFDYFPYRLDLAPKRSLSLLQDEDLAGTPRVEAKKHFFDEVNNWLDTLVVLFFGECLQKKWVIRYDKCLHFAGDNLEM